LEHLELVQLVGIILLAVAAQWIAWRLKLPSILLLLSFGLIAGPILGAFGARLFYPDELFGPSFQPIVSASVAVILFEGSLTLQFREFERYGWLVFRLLSVGAIVTCIGCTIGARYLLDVPWSLAALFGANLVVTGPTVIGPLLRHIRPDRRVGAILKWESIVIDPIGASLTVLLFEAMFGLSWFDQPAARIASVVFLTLLAGIVLGALGAFVAVIALKNYLVPDSLHSSFALAIVLTVHAGANLIQAESGLLAVTCMGILLANQKQVVIKHIIEFKEALRDLLIGALFVMLAARLALQDLADAALPAIAFLVFSILIVRPLGIFASTFRSDLRLREKLFLSWMAPRGVVAAAVASALALKLQGHSPKPELAVEQPPAVVARDDGSEEPLSPDGGTGHSPVTDEVAEKARRLAPATFVVIIGTVAVYGLTAGRLAKRLGVTGGSAKGVLLLGAHEWGLELAKALKEQGCPVLVVDSSRTSINAARLSGLPTYHGSVLSEHAHEEIDLAEIGRLLAITRNDEVNSLACLRFVEFFGRQETYQLPFDVARSEGRQEKVPSTQRGRFLFSPNLTFSRIEELRAKGAVFKTTRLSGEFTFADWTAKYADRAVPLFLLKKNGELQVYTPDVVRKPAAGDAILALLSPAQDESPLPILSAKESPNPTTRSPDAVASGSVDEPEQGEAAPQQLGPQ
jgi:NhaP-type Na+/H+ or K+/H+ antiporter